MQADVDGGMRGVSKTRTLVKTESAVAIAQYESSEAPSLEFLAQAASEPQGHIFFGQLIAEGSPALIASMAGVDDGEVGHQTVDVGAGDGASGLDLRSCLRSSDGDSWLRRWRLCCSLARTLRRGCDDDGPAVIAEAGKQGCSPGYGDLGCAVVFLIACGRDRLAVEGKRL